uniref:Protein MMS22-like n=1 Tax=Salmo trutta TaxID=8032 RepID=A0A674EEM6_SALTR
NCLPSVSFRLQLLLHLAPAPADYEEDTVDIFGFPWVTETALVESTKLLFGLFRQKLLKLETLVQSSSHDFGQASSLRYEAEDLRKQCVLFLQYVKVFLYRYLEPTCPLEEGPCQPYEELEAQLPSALLEELFEVTLLIGRLKDLPANIQSALTIQHQGKLFPPFWHLLCLHLDIHWSVVYAHQFVNLTGENLTNNSLFEEHLCNLLSDLTGLAMGKYSKVMCMGPLTSHHYHCTCTKELWILPIHLLEHRSKVLHTQSFWNYMNTLLRSLISGQPVAEEYGVLPTHCKDPLGFTWWLVTHLAELGQYSRNGAFQNEKQLEDNWSFVGELLLIDLCVLQRTLQEDQIRMHVHCCLNLSVLWKPKNSTVTTKPVPWLGVSGLCSVSRTPLALLDQARIYCSPSPLLSPSHTQLYRSANSFHIFLRVLALYLAQENAGGFHQRRMQELSEAGLMNFLCWAFSQTAREFYLKTTEPSRRLALWGPLGSYLGGVAEVFETSVCLGLSEEKLLNEEFGLLLPACRQSELSSALGFLQIVLRELRVGKGRHLAVAAALWANLFPFLRSLRLSNTPPAQLADAAAGQMHTQRERGREWEEWGRRINVHCTQQFHTQPVCLSQGACLRKQLRDVISKYLDHFLPATPSVGATANHPALLAHLLNGQTTGSVSYLFCVCLHSENFLHFKGNAPPPRLVTVLAFLLELLRRNNAVTPPCSPCPFPSLLRCLKLVNERTSTEALQLVVERCSAAAGDAPCDQTVTVLR